MIESSYVSFPSWRILYIRGQTTEVEERARPMKCSSATAVILAAVQTAAGLANGLGATPQMGWNNWNAYACDIDEASVLENAHALVDSGLSRLGYDCTC